MSDGARRDRRTARMLGVPLLREGTPIGVLIVAARTSRGRSPTSRSSCSRPSPTRPSSPSRTRGCSRRCRRARASCTIARGLRRTRRGLGVSSQLDARSARWCSKTIVDRAVELSGTDAGSIFYYREDEQDFELGETTGSTRRSSRGSASSTSPRADAVWARRSPSDSRLQIPDLHASVRAIPLRDAVLEAGLRASLIVPLLPGRGRSARWCCGARSQASSRQADRQPDADLRRPVGDRHRERAPVRGDRPEEPRAGDRQPAQVAVRRQHEPRAEDPARRHPRLRRADAGRLLRAARPRNRWTPSRASAPTASTCWA